LRRRGLFNSELGQVFTNPMVMDAVETDMQ
jgi:hypothetical protein